MTDIKNDKEWVNEHSQRFMVVLMQNRAITNELNETRMMSDEEVEYWEMKAEL